jgi:hypothetical protein
MFIQQQGCLFCAGNSDLCKGNLGGQKTYMNPSVLTTLFVLETKSQTGNSASETFRFDADAVYCQLAAGTDKSYGFKHFPVPGHMSHSLKIMSSS